MKFLECLECSSSAGSSFNEIYLLEDNKFYCCISKIVENSAEAITLPTEKDQLSLVPFSVFPVYNEALHRKMWQVPPNGSFIKYPSFLGYNAENPQLSNICSYFSVELSVYQAINNASCDALSKSCGVITNNGHVVGVVLKRYVCALSQKLDFGSAQLDTESIINALR